MAPLAARWHDTKQNVYTIAELQMDHCVTNGRRRPRIVIASEQTHRNADEAEKAWGRVAARHTNAESLEGAPAQEVILHEVVEKMNCLWSKISDN